MKICNKNILIIVLLLLLVFMILPIKSYAASGTINPNKYKPNTNGVENASDLVKKANVIVGALQTIGIVSSVAILAAMGIKYMIGSTEEKAEYKETMIPYLIGAFLVFTVTTIPNIIFQFSKNLNKY